MYKKASKLKLRFQTQKGNLSVEQLWDLSLDDLKIEVKKQYEINKENASHTQNILQVSISKEYFKKN